MSHHLWFRVFDRRALRFTRLALNSGQVRVFADAVTPDAEVALRRGPLPVGVFSLKPVHISVEDAHGRNLHARADELLSILIARAASPLDDTWLPRSQKPWAAEWHRMHAALLYDQIKPIADFLAFIERAYGVGESEPPDTLIVDVGRHSGAFAVISPSNPPPLQLPFPFFVRGRVPGVVATVCCQIFRMAVTAFLTPLRQMRRGPPERRIVAGGRGVVLVEYEAAGWDRMPLGQAQDWIELSGLAREQVVFYFDRADSPLDDVARRALASSGHGWIDYAVPTWHVRHPLAILFSSVIELLTVMPMPWRRESLRRWAVLAHFLPGVYWRREFLRTAGAVAIYQLDEFTPRQVALNLACRQEGVAFVWSFHSVLFFFEYMRYAFVDLLLAWGELDLGFANVAGFDYRYAVTTGALGTDGIEPDDAKQAAEWRARLTAKPRFVVTLFDSSYDGRQIHHSAERCAEFYKVALRLMRQNQDWGCVIKSKADSYNRLPRESGIQDVVAELSADGRCLVLPKTVKPSLAALVGDAVACYSINTAGFQAALNTGRRALHFDPNHLSMHPLFVPGEGKIIFSDAISFATALRAVAAGDKQFGDIAPWAHLLDPFRDGVARKRSGEVIRDYVAARDRGLDRDSALHEAVTAYALRYRPALATTRLVSHAGDADSLWRQVVQQHYPDAPPDFPFSEGMRSTLSLSSGRRPSELSHIA